MAQAKLSLTAPETIPLDHLVIHDDNVRHIKSGVSIETLAADIARRGLLQSLSVRAITDGEGAETGTYGVQAGGRRLKALQLLVKQKKLAKNAPIPCIVRTEGFAEADSLAENCERETLHPIDQYKAFAALKAKGQGEETIAAAFGVTAAVVKQRLKLANASPVLLKAFEDDEIDLDQLKAFCITDDHARQDQVWEMVRQSWNKSPNIIRRALLETTVRADDKRARFIGVEAYEAAGGVIVRDLFDEDDGGWLQDVPLLEKLVTEKLTAEAETVKAEGWGWVETAIDFPWNHERGYRALKPIAPALSNEEEAQFEALSAEYEELECIDDDERSEQSCERLKTLKALLSVYENKSPVFDETQKAKAGAFVSLNCDGFVQIERGYVRHEDAAAITAVHGPSETFTRDDEGRDYATGMSENAASSIEEEDDGGNTLPDRLMIELTAYRSLALRDALANDHKWAYLAVLHALTLRLFYRYSTDTCLQIDAKEDLVSPFAGLNDFAAAKTIANRHKAWEEALPEQEADLWDFLITLDRDNREALFAHCAGLAINAVHEPQLRVSQRRRHGDRLADALRLDMAKSGWTTRAENYLNRVTKAQIIDAVREAKGDKTADLLADLKKKDMALEAERLLDSTGWLPEPLRTPAALDEAAAPSLPAFLEESELQAAE